MSAKPYEGDIMAALSAVHETLEIPNPIPEWMRAPAQPNGSE